MLTLSIDEAQAGMKLAVNVPHPASPEHDLLTAGYVLDDRVLARMRELGVTFLYVDYPPLSDLDEALLPLLSPARRNLYGQMKRSIEAVQRSARPHVSYAAYYALTRQFLTGALRDGRQPYYLDEMSLRLGDSAVVHATTVAHLCLMLGAALEGYVVRQRRHIGHDRVRELLNLGVAGMLHDIGKASFPAKVRAAHALRPPEAEQGGERDLWQSHPQVGYEMIRSDVDPTAAAAVRLHHQHFDGSGFPHHKAQTTSQNYFEGAHIHVYARILLAADLYDRLSFRPDGRRRYAFEVLHLMRSRHESWLDPEILAAIPRVIPPFAPGMKVELTDGTSAAVVGFTPKTPYRPIVKRFGLDGWALGGEAIDLSRTEGLAVRLAAGVPVAGFLPGDDVAAGAA